MDIMKLRNFQRSLTLWDENLLKCYRIHNLWKHSRVLTVNSDVSELKSLELPEVSNSDRLKYLIFPLVRHLKPQIIVLNSGNLNDTFLQFQQHLQARRLFSVPFTVGCVYLSCQSQKCCLLSE